MELNFQAKVGRAALQPRDWRSDAPHLFLIPDSNWAFVHITKTGGTSFRMRFQLPKPGHSPNRKHLSKEEIRLSIAASEFSDLRFVSIVRNPFTRFRSYCHYRAKRFNISPNLTAFAKDFELRTTTKKGSFEQRLARQVDWLMGPSGEIEVDALLRFENFEEELDAFSQHIGLERGGAVETPNPNPSHYTCSMEEEYTPEVVAFVQDYFREDFEAFGYDLDFPESAVG